MALQFCLHDGEAGGYVKTTSQGKTFWRDPGEHAYLVLGMLAACEAAPDMEVRLGNETGPTTLHRWCVRSLDALADLYRLTGDARYRKRAEAIPSYLCGDNPWQMRLFNELGAVYNWTEDTNGDGVEDLVRQDLYPESTAFCQIGIMHRLRSLAAVEAQDSNHPSQKPGG